MYEITLNRDGELDEQTWSAERLDRYLRLHGLGSWYYELECERNGYAQKTVPDGSDTTICIEPVG